MLSLTSTSVNFLVRNSYKWKQILETVINIISFFLITSEFNKAKFQNLLILIKKLYNYTMYKFKNDHHLYYLTFSSSTLQFL